MILGLALILVGPALARGTETYAEAYRVATQTGRPMVVFVGAEWCGACQAMKREVIPEISRRCLRGGAAFATVNLDRQRALARKLIRGGPIPQLLMFRRAADGWRLSRLTGGQTLNSAEAFVDRGLRRDAAAKAEMAQAAQVQAADSQAQQTPTERPSEVASATHAHGSG